MDNRFVFTTTNGETLVVFAYQVAAYIAVNKDISEIFLENGRAFLVRSSVAEINKAIDDWQNNAKAIVNYEMPDNWSIKNYSKN